MILSYVSSSQFLPGRELVWLLTDLKNTLSFFNFIGIRLLFCSYHIIYCIILSVFNYGIFLLLLFYITLFVDGIMGFGKTSTIFFNNS